MANNVQARQVLDAAEKIRDIGRHIPSWHCETRDGQAFLVDSVFGEVLAEFTGAWVPGLIAFFEAFHTDTVVGVAELLWRIAQGAPSGIVTTADYMVKSVREATVEQVEPTPGSDRRAWHLTLPTSKGSVETTQ